MGSINDDDENNDRSGGSIMKGSESENDHLIASGDPQHPANLICELCRKFYGLGWVGIHSLHCSNFLFHSYFILSDFDL